MPRTQRRQQAEQTRFLAAALGVLIGLALFRNGSPFAQTGGLVLGVPCAVWLAMQAGRVLREWQREREREAAKAAKQVRQAERRRRGLQTREQQARQRTAQAQAERKRLAAQDAHRQEDHARTEAETRRRTDRDLRVQAEAERWQAMNAETFHAELAALLYRRGLVPLENAPNRFAGNREIALCVTDAQEADVETLEQWRCDCGAERACLIAQRGFAFEAVRRVRDFPAVLLVEAFLLAEWNLHGTEPE